MILSHVEDTFAALDGVGTLEILLGFDITLLSLSTNSGGMPSTIGFTLGGSSVTFQLFTLGVALGM